MSDADTLHRAAARLAYALGPDKVTVSRLRSRLNWGYCRTERAYQALVDSGRWEWAETAERPQAEEDTYKPTEADLEAVRKTWSPAEERRRKLWQIKPASIPGADRYGEAT